MHNRLSCDSNFFPRKKLHVSHVVFRRPSIPDHVVEVVPNDASSTAYPDHRWHLQCYHCSSRTVERQPPWETRAASVQVCSCCLVEQVVFAPCCQHRVGDNFLSRLGTYSYQNTYFIFFFTVFSYVFSLFSPVFRDLQNTPAEYNRIHCILKNTREYTQNTHRIHNVQKRRKVLFAQYTC